MSGQGVKNKTNVTPRSWGDQCQTWELLSGKELVVFHERMPPGTAEIEHYHERARQFFFVLEGQLVIKAMGKSHVLNVHDGLEIPPGEVHHVTNVSGGVTQFIAVANPTTIGDRKLPAAS